MPAMDKEITSVIRTDEDFPLQEVSKWYSPQRLETITRSPKRTNNAVHDAFDLIGGVPRLALWAHNNPGEFFTKILPRTLQSATQTEHSGEVIIRTAIPRTVLDGSYQAEQEGHDDGEPPAEGARSR